MTQPTMHEITDLLIAWSDGDNEALERLTPLVYQELRRLARGYMRGEAAGHTLQTTALVNEAYMRLIDANRMRWQNRAHFFAVSAQMMRHILVDFARARGNMKRGGGVARVSLNEAMTMGPERGAELVALDDALTALAKLDERQSKVVELRFFGGLTEAEIAEVLNVSPRTVSGDWNLARSWLLRELSKSEGSGE
ncbi:MAG TPA: sigma-70 family RNA polymerase sigma factor [Blastocatellia bacterium]|nr:sigma-70 family RNA polymerase sigma factor [Blastocatellia bacterium]